MFPKIVFAWSNHGYVPSLVLFGIILQIVYLIPPLTHHSFRCISANLGVLCCDVSFFSFAIYCPEIERCIAALCASGHFFCCQHSLETLSKAGAKALTTKKKSNTCTVSDGFNVGFRLFKRLILKQLPCFAAVMERSQRKSKKRFSLYH